MAFWDKWFKKATPQVRASADEINLPFSSSLARTSLPRGAESIIEGYSGNPTYRIITQRIAESFAAIDWTLTNKINPDLPTFNPLYEAWIGGSSLFTGFETREVLQVCFELFGEAFARKYYSPKSGMVLGLWPLNPSWIQGLPDVKNPYFKFTRGQFTESIPKEDIIYLRNPNPQDPYARGTGIGYTMRQELDTDEYLMAYLQTFFENQARPDAIVSIEGASEVEIKGLIQQWRDEHRSVRKAHRMHFTNKSIDAQVLGSGLRDLGVSELRENLRKVIREGWGIPPEIVGVLNESNRATIESAEYIFARWTLVPRAKRWRDVLQYHCDLANPGSKVNFISPIPDDKTFKLAVMREFPHVFSREEIRELAGKEPDSETSVYYKAPGLVEYQVDNIGSEQEQIDRTSADKDSWRSLVTERSFDETRTLSTIEIDQIVRNLTPDQLDYNLNEIWPTQYEIYGNAMLEALPVSISVRFDMGNPLVKENLRKLGTEIKGINDTTRDLLRAELTAGVNKGEGINKLMKRVQGVMGPDVNKVRAHMIARNEVFQSAQRATLDAWGQSGVVEAKQWISALLKTSRKTHILLHSDVKPLNGMFLVGGHPAPAPGLSGVASEDINCYCATIPVVVGNQWTESGDPDPNANIEGIELRSLEFDGEPLNPNALEQYRLAILDLQDPWINKTTPIVENFLQMQYNETIEAIKRLF